MNEPTRLHERAAALARILAATTMHAPALRRVPHTEAVPGRTLYRHSTWPPGRYGTFLHAHTADPRLADFEFYEQTDQQDTPAPA